MAELHEFKVPAAVAMAVAHGRPELLDAEVARLWSAAGGVLVQNAALPTLDYTIGTIQAVRTLLAENQELRETIAQLSRSDRAWRIAFRSWPCP